MATLDKYFVSTMEQRPHPKIKIYIGIVGYYGNEKEWMNAKVYQRLLKKVRAIIRDTFHIDDKAWRINVTLVANGSTWCNHAPVSLALQSEQPVAYLELHFAMEFDTQSTQFETDVQSRRKDANSLNWSHKFMSDRMTSTATTTAKPISSTHELKRAMALPSCASYVHNSFAARDAAFAKRLTHLIFITPFTAPNAHLARFGSSLYERFNGPKYKLDLETLVYDDEPAESTTHPSSDGGVKRKRQEEEDDAPPHERAPKRIKLTHDGGGGGGGEEGTRK